MKVSVNWLKEYVMVQGSSDSLAHSLTMSGLEVKKLDRVNGDTIYETEITTNRPDWLSHIGVARELHAIKGGPFKLPPTKYHGPRILSERYRIVTESKKLCPYYSAVLLENIEWTNAPSFMKERLEGCGIRSINFIVDITNYVLLEFGQPLHAFDADRISGNVISARRAAVGEKMIAIDGNTYELTRDDLAICDEKGPIAIGGVMGGKNTEVTEQTRNVLLESAFFAPFSIRSTSRRLALTSESSYRFERRVDPKGVDLARERAVYLICENAKVGSVSQVFRGGVLPERKRTVLFDLAEVKKILGIKIPEMKAKEYLKRLGLAPKGRGKRWKVDIPAFRDDLTRPIDLVEEVARLHGFGQIPESLPLVTPKEIELERMFQLESRARELCIGMGLQEAITYSVVDPSPLLRLHLEEPNWLRLLNPQNKELTLMRPSLLPGLLNAVRTNLHAGERVIQFFEIGNRYLENCEGRFPFEERMLSIIICGDERFHWSASKRESTFYDLKGMVETLFNRLYFDDIKLESASDSRFISGQVLAVQGCGRMLGKFGTLIREVLHVYDIKKNTFFAELNLEFFLQKTKQAWAISPIPKFPPSPRDLTLVVSDDVRADDIVREIKTLGGELISKIEIFDQFKGGKLPEKKKSISLTVEYQSQERTLENEVVNKLHFSIIDHLTKKCKATLPEG
jgi:phenylalanyl-tRNA synthetase beta chain